MRVVSSLPILFGSACTRGHHQLLHVLFFNVGLLMVVRALGAVIPQQWLNITTTICETAVRQSIKPGIVNAMTE